MAKDEKPKHEQLLEIVRAGLNISEARALLEDGYSFEQVLDLAHEQAARAKAAAVDAQTAAAKTMQKAMKPENQEHPHISAFSYPEGDIARPRGDLPYRFFFNAYPSHMFPETEHWREWELMKQVQPGEFTIMRRDGSKMAVTVKAERDADLNITELSVEFPVSREEKALVPPKMVVLYQLVYHDNPRKRFLEAMHEYYDLFMAESVPVAVQ